MESSSKALGSGVVYMQFDSRDARHRVQAKLTADSTAALDGDDDLFAFEREVQNTQWKKWNPSTGEAPPLSKLEQRAATRIFHAIAGDDAMMDKTELVHAHGGDFKVFERCDADDSSHITTDEFLLFLQRKKGEKGPKWFANMLRTLLHHNATATAPQLTKTAEQATPKLAAREEDETAAAAKRNPSVTVHMGSSFGQEPLPSANVANSFDTSLDPPHDPAEAAAPVGEVMSYAAVGFDLDFESD